MSATPATFESSACRCAGLRPAIEPGLIERDHTDAPSTQKAGVAWSRRVHPDEHNAHLSASPNLLGPVSVGRGRSGTPTVLLLPRPCRRRKTTTDYNVTVSIRKSRGGHAGARRDRFSAVTP